MPRPLYTLSGAVVWLFAVACGGAGDPGEPPRSEAGDRMRLHGVVESGVEPGCLLLADSRQYLLLEARASGLSAGQEVEVLGEPKPDLVTTCQQGVPFLVDEVVGP